MIHNIVNRLNEYSIELKRNIMNNYRVVYNGKSMHNCLSNCKDIVELSRIKHIKYFTIDDAYKFLNNVLSGINCIDSMHIIYKKWLTYAFNYELGHYIFSIHMNDDNREFKIYGAQINLLINLECMYKDILNGCDINKYAPFWYDNR